MIKNLGRRKLSRTGSHKKAMMRNLATSLFQHERIKTTLSKAKELAGYSAKLITIARPGDLNAKRALSREIKDDKVRSKIFEVIIPRYQNRPGGYTQIYRVGLRSGDRASMAVIKLVS